MGATSSIAALLAHNHGYPTVDPLKPALITCSSVLTTPHNHGYPTVDPLKPIGRRAHSARYASITTVIRPWTH